RQGQLTRGWGSVASDPSGTNLVATGNIVVVSTDGGTTWTDVTSSVAPVVQYFWTTSTIGGGEFFVGAGGGDIWHSSEGVLWADVTAGSPADGQGWTSIAATSDANLVLGAAASNDIFVGRNSGVWTWTDLTMSGAITPIGTWTSAAISADGSIAMLGDDS